MGGSGPSRGRVWSGRVGLGRVWSQNLPSWVGRVVSGPVSKMSNTRANVTRFLDCFFFVKLPQIRTSNFREVVR